MSDDLRRKLGLHVRVPRKVVEQPEGCRVRRVIRAVEETHHRGDCEILVKEELLARLARLLSHKHRQGRLVI